MSTCESCGSTLIDGCARCGAPQCCPVCCEYQAWASIGEKWTQDSSLETWFPFTAQELASLKGVKAERDEAVRQRNEAVGHFLLMSSQCDELRECLLAVSRLDYLNEHNALAEKVRAVLSKTKP